MIIIIAIHAGIALKTHSMTHPAVLTGFAMTTFFLIFSVSTYIKATRLELRKKIGRSVWRMVVLVILIVLFGLLGYHIIA
jgi:hypothetical protein